MIREPWSFFVFSFIHHPKPAGLAAAALCSVKAVACLERPLESCVLDLKGERRAVLWDATVGVDVKIQTEEAWQT